MAQPANTVEVVVGQPPHTVPDQEPPAAIQVVLTNTIGLVVVVVALANLDRIIKVDLEPAAQSQVLV